MTEPNMTGNMRVEPIERATNRTWDEWLAFMDSINAKELSHHEIATKVLEELMGQIDSPAWWAQGITVAYEQAIGRRLPGQRSDGTFQTSVSRATTLGMQDLMTRWEAFAAADPEVLGLVAGDVRVSGTENRISWRAKAADGSAIVVISEPKTKGASIVAQLMGLATLELNNEAKAQWQRIVGRFLETL